MGLATIDPHRNVRISPDFHTFLKGLSSYRGAPGGKMRDPGNEVVHFFVNFLRF